MSSLFNLATATAAGGHRNRLGYQISRSVRLRASATGYFSRSAYPVASAGTQWTLSMWVKRGTLGTQTDLFSFVSTAGSAQQAGIQFDSNNNIRWWQYVSPSYAFQKITTAVFRDPSAWYHLVFVYDTTLATAADRCQVWVNGVRLTAFSTSTDPTQNLVTYYKNGTHYPHLGAENRNASSALSPFDGYMTEVNFIDGQALTPSSFGETSLVTGVWQPKRYTGTYGTNGFDIDFSDNSAATAAAIGKDYSGNGNNWTPNNISVTAGVTFDSMLDVPTQFGDGGNGRGNYVVFNPVNVSGGGTTTITDGSLATSVGSTTTYGKVLGSIGMSTGKWYWEVTVTAVGGAGNIGIGDGTAPSASFGLGGVAGEIAYQSSGNKYTNNSGTAYGASYTTNDVIGVAYDADAGSITFYKNNASQGAITGFSGTKFPAVGSGGGTNPQYAANFGQRPFTYTPPSGFKALNTQNLSTPTILRGNQYFDVSTWSGNASTRSIVNDAAMQPDLVWIKKRGGGTTPTRDHRLFDAVRGATLYLSSNATGAEITETDGLTAFNSNGFTLGASDGVNGTTGGTGTYVGWQWKEGATQGFDIVTYTGTGANRTVSHSLGVTPSMIIVKARNLPNSIARSWSVWHTALAATEVIFLNQTSAKQTGATTYWNSTLPTSSVFSLGDEPTVNGAVGTVGEYVAYLFSEVAGFSKFGSYTGNGAADGPFVFTGFRPRFVMWKRSDATANWFLMDSSRTPANPVNLELYADQSNAEVTFTDCDFVSNGFKLRTSDSSRNASGGTYIFAAFAENPFKNALAR
jgi:hypothetical protein